MNLLNMCRGIDEQSAAGNGRILSQPYSLLPVDLRDAEALRRELRAAGFDPQLPTLVLAECVLVYMEVRRCRTVGPGTALPCLMLRCQSPRSVLKCARSWLPSQRVSV